MLRPFPADIATEPSGMDHRVIRAARILIVLALAAAVGGAIMQQDAYRQLSGMRSLHPLRLANASVGDVGYLDATVGTPGTELLGPVSQQPDAYWEVTRTRYWEEYEECGNGGRNGCDDGWVDESRQLSRDRSGDELPIRVGGTDASVKIAKSSQIRDLPTLSSIQHEDRRFNQGSEFGPSIGARDNSMIESVERGLRPGDQVLVIAKVARTSGTPRLVATHGQPVAIAGTTFRGHTGSLTRRATNFGYLLYAGIAGVVFGIVLLRVATLRRRA